MDRGVRFDSVPVSTWLWLPAERVYPFWVNAHSFLCALTFSRERPSFEPYLYKRTNWICVQCCNTWGFRQFRRESENLDYQVDFVEHWAVNLTRTSWTYFQGIGYCIIAVLGFRQLWSKPCFACVTLCAYTVIQGNKNGQQPKTAIPDPFSLRHKLHIL